MKQVDDTISISERVPAILSLLGCDETTAQSTFSYLEEIIGSEIASVEIFPNEHRRILTVTDTKEISYYAVIEKRIFRFCSTQRGCERGTYLQGNTKRYDI